MLGGFAAAMKVVIVITHMLLLWWHKTVIMIKMFFKKQVVHNVVLATWTGNEVCKEIIVLHKIKHNDLVLEMFDLKLILLVC